MPGGDCAGVSRGGGKHEFGSVRCVGTVRWMGEERAFQAKGKSVPVTHRGGEDF